MPSSDPLVSVIVVNWNRRELLAACLARLGHQDFRDFELIVVDNGSTDGSVELLRGPQFAPLRLIENPRNVGFCAANNQGIRAARGNYIALLNNDAEPAPAWLGKLVAALESRPEVGMVASKILLSDDPGIIDKAGHLIYPDGQNRGRGTGERDQGQYDRLEETAWPDGCAALYRKSMLEGIGGFDEDFFAYADDAELGLRARIAGWGCLYVPDAVVYHHVGSTLGPYSDQRLFLIERNRLWLAAKLFPWPLLLVNPLYFTLRLAASGVAAALGRGELHRAVAARGRYALLKCLIRANWAAWAGLPAMLRKRRQIRTFRKLRPPQVSALLRRFRVPLVDLVSKAR